VGGQGGWTRWAGQQPGQLTARRTVHPLKQLPMTIGWESQLVIGQIVRPRTTKDADSHVLVDHDHDKASTQSLPTPPPTSGSASETASSVAWNSSIKSPVVIRRNSSLPSSERRGSPARRRRRRCSSNSSPKLISTIVPCPRIRLCTPAIGGRRRLASPDGSMATSHRSRSSLLAFLLFTAPHPLTLSCYPAHQPSPLVLHTVVIRGKSGSPDTSVGA